MQAKDHTAGNLCRKGTILWLLSCWPLYVVKLLNKHSPWLTPRVGEAQCFGRSGLTATGASKEPGRNRNKERRKIQMEEEMHVGHHSPMVGEGSLGNRDCVGSRGVASSSGLSWAVIAMRIWILCILLLSQLVVSRPLNHPLAGR